MARKRDPLNLSANWHFDCRIESELPEDRTVGTRFLLSTLFGSLAVIMVTIAGWLAYRTVSLHSEIRFWQQQIENDQADIQDIRLTQQQYNTEAAKIDRVVSLIHPPLLVSRMISALGRAKPDTLLLDSIEWNQNSVVVLGSGPSALRVNGYVDALKADPSLTSLFSDRIYVSNYEAMRNQEGRYAFEITLNLARP